MHLILAVLLTLEVTILLLVDEPLTAIKTGTAIILLHNTLLWRMR